MALLTYINPWVGRATRYMYIAMLIYIKSFSSVYLRKINNQENKSDSTYINPWVGRATRSMVTFFFVWNWKDGMAQSRKISVVPSLLELGRFNKVWLYVYACSLCKNTGS
jgi:hypothetical protein